MIVYRVEHKETFFGPYWNSKHCKECKIIAKYIANKHNRDLKRWPAFDYFELRSIGQKLNADSVTIRFGFLTLEDLKTWFSDDLTVMTKCEYYVRKYCVEDEYVHTEHKQVVFNKTRARVQTEYPVDSAI